MCEIVCKKALASPQTGLAPAGCRELVARLRHNCSFAISTPELQDARIVILKSST